MFIICKIRIFGITVVTQRKNFITHGLIFITHIPLLWSWSSLSDEIFFEMKRKNSMTYALEVVTCVCRNINLLSSIEKYL